MSITPILNPTTSLEEINEFEMPKTPTMVYTPVLKPQDSFGMPSFLNLSNKNPFNLKNEEEHPLTDDECKRKLIISFRYVEPVKRKIFSGQNLKSDKEKEEEDNYFYPKGKKFNEDSDSDYVLEANELDSDNEVEKIEKIKNKENDEDADNEGDDEDNLGILTILKNKKKKLKVLIY